MTATAEPTVDVLFSELAAGATEATLPPAYRDAVTPDPAADGGPLDETLPSAEEPRPLSVKERIANAAKRAKSPASNHSGAEDPPVASAKPPGRTSPASVTVPKLREGHFVKPLTQLYTTIGLTLMPFDQACATAFVANAESCAKSLDALARENDAVRKALLALTQTGAWGAVLMAHAPLILMIMTHHGPEQMKERIAPLAMVLNGNAFAAQQEEAKAA